MTKPIIEPKSNLKLLNLRALENKLEELSVRISIIIKAKGQSIKYMNSTVEQLDRVIVNLAKRTLALKSRNGDNSIINRLKEQSWTLLEKLEDYCVTNLNISIW